MKSMPAKFSTYKTDVLDLKLGINENVSSLELQGGELIDCKNYMLAEGGYGGYLSVPGYEAMDGATMPSTFESLVLTITDSSIPVENGQLITGVTTGATCVALDDGVLVSGAYEDGDARIEVECLIDAGTFTTSESVSTASGTVGTLFVIKELTGGTEEHHLALDFVRSLVTEVPGEGPILGLHVHQQKVYAFRKAIAANTVAFFVEDLSTGWVEIDTSSDPILYGDNNFKFSDYNFYATDGSFSMYWVDGVNQARSYNVITGAVITIDNTGMSVQSLDSPTHIAAHNYHLFLGYRGGSLQFSKVGDPETWDAVVGAGEIGLGNEITNLVPGVQSSLIIFLTEGIRVLQGNVIDEFVLEVFSETSGAFDGTAQRLLGTVFSVDDRGVTTMQAVQEYGDYAANSISQRFKQTLRNKNHTILTTCVSRDLNQYRIFFDDRQAIYVSFEGKEYKGATFVEFPDVVSIIAQGEDVDKRDYIVFGNGEDEGYVYRMDSGTSFNGTAITARMSTSFFHYGSPRSYKAFKRATFEIAGESGQEFDIKVDFDYNELGSVRTIWYTPQVYSTEGGAVYGEGRWGIMKYGTGVVATNRVPVYLQGVGTNMSYKVISNEAYRAQHIIQNIITDYNLVGRRV